MKEEIEYLELKTVYPDNAPSYLIKSHSVTKKSTQNAYFLGYFEVSFPPRAAVPQKGARSF
jgi:hypothetical protein